ncbi:MAG: WD40 repeat domain-containing serine/threonine protein kinase [Verrucomicrobiota bacterium]
MISAAKVCMDCGAVLAPAYPAMICAPCLWSGGGGGGGGPEFPPAGTDRGTADPAVPKIHTAASAMRVPGHDILEEIARGGMGVVYRARERETHRTVALKMLRPGLADEEGMRERFRLEASAVAALEHPSILPVYRVDESDDMPFFTMKLAAHGTLAERKEALRGRWREIAGLFITLAGAVQHAHQHGVLHRDLKPHNVLFDEAEQVYLADFGLVKLIDSVSELTGSRNFLGTPHYSAPEVASANARAATVASDVWSLGAMLYELLTGRLPFEAEGLAPLLRRIAEEPPSPILTASGIPRDLGVITLKCLQKDPAQRYDSAGALAADLRAWLEGRPIRARPASFAERAVAWARRNPLPASMAGALAVSLTVLTGLLAQGLHTSRKAAADARAAEILSRKAETASRHAEAASLLEETRARLRDGQWVDRQAAIDSVLRSRRLHPSDGARDVLLSLLALPQLEQTGSVPYSQGRPVFFSGDLSRYVTGEKTSAAVRSTADGSVIRIIPAAPHPAYPAGPISGDGTRMMLRGAKRTAVWDIAGASELVSFPGGPGNMTFSADGRRAACGIYVADLRASPPVIQPAGLIDPDYTVRAISPDGGWILKASAQRLSIRVIEAATGLEVREYSASGKSMVHCAEWTPDGRTFYTGSVDGKLARWSYGETTPDWIMHAHADGVDSLALFDGGRHLITQGRDGQTKFWDLRTMTAVLTLPWAGLRVMAARDGQHLAVDCPPDRASRLYSFKPPVICSLVRLPASLVTNSYFQGEAAVIFAEDSGSFAVTSGHDLHFLDREGEIRRSLACERCDGLAVDPAGGFARIRNSSPIHKIYRCPVDWPGAWNDDRLALGVWNGTGSLVAGNLKAGRLLVNVGDRMLISSRPGPRLQSAPASGEAAGARTGTATATGAVTGTGPESEASLSDLKLPGLEPTGRLTAMAFSPSGRLLAVAGMASRRQPGHRILIHKTDDFSVTAEWPSTAETTALAFTADETALLTGDGKNILCHELATGAERWRIPHQRPLVTRNHASVRLAVATRAGTIAAALTPETVSLLDPGTGRILRTLHHPTNRTIRNFGISPDGTRLAAVGSYLVQLWRLDAVEEELAKHGMTGVGGP